MIWTVACCLCVLDVFKQNRIGRTHIRERNRINYRRFSYQTHLVIWLKKETADCGFIYYQARLW